MVICLFQLYKRRDRNGDGRKNWNCEIYLWLWKIYNPILPSQPIHPFNT